MNRKKLLYVMSVPERTIKSIVSVGTGISSLLTKLLLPSAVKDSATYRVTFGMLQQFLIEKVAEVEASDKKMPLKDHYVVRKAAGAVIEGVGLVSIRFSPVWMLAILSDVSGGSRIYLKRLLEDLKKSKLIDAGVNYDNVYDLLEGINKSSKMGVTAIDTPPISTQEFIAFKDLLMAQLKDNNTTSMKLFEDLEKVYEKMKAVGRQEKMSLRKLNGAMTLDLMKNTAKKGFDITMVTTKTSLDMINETVIKSYMDSLDQVNKIGKRKYLVEHMTPFMKQFTNHYRKDKKTLTERVFGWMDTNK
ncbi:MAG: hypothetical protein H7X94_10395 [Vallitaleaceae bacterium]|nr:hypothetical protein [Vallitaleaceae bacterium]